MTGTRSTRRSFCVATAALAAAPLRQARAQPAGPWPQRDISFILPWSPGGSTDPIARQFCSQLEKLLGRSVNVENKPGGSGTIGVGLVVRARPDGHTIGYAGNGTLAYQPMVNKGLAWEKEDDYQPLVKLFDMPTVLFVPANAPWKTFQDFMAAAKDRPNTIRVAVSGLRTSSDMVLQQLNRIANVRIRTVPFTGGSGESVVALLGGRVEAMAGYTAGNLGHVQSGSMRALAVFQKGRYEPFPQAQSVVDLGYAADLQATNYVIGPKGMPGEVLDKLAGACMAVVRSDEYGDFARRNGLVLEPLGPDAIRSEIVRCRGVYAELIRFLDAKT